MQSGENWGRASGSSRCTVSDSRLLGRLADATASQPTQLFCFWHRVPRCIRICTLVYSILTQALLGRAILSHLVYSMYE